MKLPVERWGRGPTRALFLHGFTGSAESFSHLERLLGDVLTATCVDLPGHRGAPLPKAAGPEGFAEVIESLGELLRESPVLIGYSQGARLALATAARFPGRVERLVLESGAPGIRRRAERSRRRAADEAMASLIRERGVDAFVERWEKLPLFAGLQALPEPDRAALRERRAGHTADGLAGALTTLGQGVQPDLWPALPGLRVPTLVLSGAKDVKYTRLARRMVAELPLGWRVTFPGVGHAPHLECPEAYAGEVRSFLAAPWLVEPVEAGP
ncbi:MAG: 2-succinyl-6-hydroxy-2,4-cyclohexadiene-1-carboxylate synthase [Myxococcota bacterium]